MNTIELLKIDLWNGIWLNTKKMFRPMTIVSIVSFALSMLLVFTIFVKIFGPAITDSITNPGSMFDLETMEERSQDIENYMKSMGPSIIGIFSLVWVSALIVGSWVLNFMLMISGSVITTGSANLVQIFTSSFNKNVFRIFLYILLTGVMYFGLALGALMLSYISSFLVFLGFLVVIVFLLRLSAGYGAIVNGGMGVSQALSFSLKNITWVRAIKIVLAGFVIFIVYGLALLAIGGIADLLGSAGMVILFIGQIAIGILWYSLLTTAYSAMYYRYADLDIESEAEVHIIDTEE